MATPNYQKLYDFLKRKGVDRIGNNADELQNWVLSDPNNIARVYNVIGSQGARNIGDNPQEFGEWLNQGIQTAAPQSSSAQSKEDPIKTPSTQNQVINTAVNEAPGTNVGSVIDNTVANPPKTQQKPIQPQQTFNPITKGVPGLANPMDRYMLDDDTIDIARRSLAGEKITPEESQILADSLRKMSGFQPGLTPEQIEMGKREVQKLQEVQSGVQSVVDDNFDTLWAAADEKHRKDKERIAQEARERNSSTLGMLGGAFFPEDNAHFEDVVKTMKSASVSYSPMQMTQDILEKIPQEVLQKALNRRLDVLDPNASQKERDEAIKAATNDVVGWIYQSVLAKGGDKFKDDMGNVGMFINQVVESTLLPTFYRMAAKSEIRAEAMDEAVKNLPANATKEQKDEARQIASQSVNLDGLDPLLVAQSQWSEAHPVSSAVATGIGMVLDPTVALGGGVGKITTAGASKLLGATLKGVSSGVGSRLLSMTGSKLYRVGTAAAGGGMNFATFEGLHNVAQQLEDYNGDFSIGDVFKTAGHGFLTGAAAGGIGGYIGAGTEALASRMTSNSGRLMTRLGGKVAGFEGEALAFSLGDIFDPDSNGWDAFMKNQGMVLGFKLFGAAKGMSAKGLDMLSSGSTKDRAANRNYRGMFQQMYDRMTAPAENGLRPDEVETLRELGYEDVARDVTDKKAIQNFITHLTSKEPDAEGAEEEAAKTEGRMAKFMADERIPFAIRGKVFWIATGVSAPLPPVAQLRKNGNEVSTYDHDGNLIERRKFDNPALMDEYIRKQHHIAELGLTDVAETARRNEIYNREITPILERLATENGYDINALRLNVSMEQEMVKAKRESGDEITDDDLQATNLLKSIEEAAVAEMEGKSLSSYADHPDRIRDRVNEKFGVDVDKALAKEARERTEDEQDAIRQYLSELDEDSNDVYGDGGYKDPFARQLKDTFERGKYAEVGQDEDLVTAHEAAREDFINYFGATPEQYFGDDLGKVPAKELIHRMRINRAPQEHIRQAEKYFLAWSGARGATFAIEKHAQVAGTMARSQAAATVHRNGKRYVVRLEDGRTAYIVDGKFNPNYDRDGKLINSKGDDAITAVDAATGETFLTSPNKVVEAAKPIDGETYLQEVEQQAREKYLQEEGARLRGEVLFQPGERIYSSRDGVINFEPAKVERVDGDIVTVKFDDGATYTFSREEVQNLNRLGRLEEWKRRNGEPTEKPIGETPTEEAPITIPMAEETPIAEGPMPEYREGTFVGVDENGREREGVISGIDPDNGIVSWYWRDEFDSARETGNNPWHESTMETFHKMVKSWKPDVEEETPVAPIEEARPSDQNIEQPQVQENAPSEPANPQPTDNAIPTKKVGRKTVTDYLAVSPERVHDNVYNEMELEEDEATEFVKGKLDAATKALTAHDKKKPKASSYSEISDYKAAKEEWKAANDQLQAERDHWQRVLDIHGEKTPKEDVVEEPKAEPIEEKAEPIEAPKEETPVEEKPAEEVKGETPLTPIEEPAEAPKEEIPAEAKEEAPAESIDDAEEKAKLSRIEESAYKKEMRNPGGEDKLDQYTNLLKDYERKGDKEMAAKTRGIIRAIDDKLSGKNVEPEKEKTNGKPAKGFIANEHSAKVSRETAALLDTTARNLGYTVRFGTREETDGAFGVTDLGSKEIILDKGLLETEDGQEKAVRTVFGHEITHILRDTSGDFPGLWDTFVKTVKDVMGDNFKATFDNYKRQYDEYHDANGWKRLPVDEIEEEVAVQLAGERLMTDPEFMQRVLQKVAENKGDAKGLVKRIKETIQGLINRLRKSFGAYPTNEQQRVLKALEDMRDSWEGMYEYAAAKEYEQTMPEESKADRRIADIIGHQMGMDDIDTEGSNRKHSTIANIEGSGLSAIKDDGKGNVIFEDEDGKRFSKENPIQAKDLMRMNNSPLKFLIDDSLAEGMDPKKAARMYEVMAGLINHYLDKGSAANGGFDNLSKDYMWVGDSIYKSVATNSDSQYLRSIDITRVCKKNEAVIRAISAMQKELKYGITPGQILDIYLCTEKNLYQAPCPVCYVFSRYVQNGQYATILMNGNKKYGHMLVDPRKLSDEEKEQRVQFWLEELEKRKKIEKRLDSKLGDARRDITTILTEIDEISEKLTSEKNPVTEEERKELIERVEYLDKRYRAALNFVSQNDLEGWIKSFAIHKVGDKWELWDDTYNLPSDDVMLDLRLTSEAIRFHPGVQRYRKSKGASTGKEVTFEANNDIGDVATMLGMSDDKLREFTTPLVTDTDETGRGRLTKDGRYVASKQNYYVMAAQEKDPKKKAELRKKARDAFRTSMLYAKRQTLRGGQRMWSWSDNIERLGPDVLVNLMQLEMLGGGLQTYSKQLEGINHVARLGGYVNGSLMGDGNGYKEISEDQVVNEGGKYYLKDGDKVFKPTAGEYAGQKIVYRTPAYFDKPTGKWYIATFDDKVGISAYGHVDKKDGKYRKGLFALNDELDRAGNIMVGMNDIHVRMMMDDDRIFFIIPWHKSGANSHILQQMYTFLGREYDPSKSQDYTLVQDEKIFKTRLWTPEEREEEYRKWLNKQKRKGKVNEDEPPKEKEFVDPGEVSQYVTDLWEEIRTTKRNIKGYGQISGEDFKCGIKGGVESGKGVLSASQVHYREMRDAILAGVHMGGSSYRMLEEEHPEWIAEIEADEFLSQLYHKIRDTLGEKGKMTTEDRKHVYPYEYWDANSTYENAEINGLRYLEYCRRLGIKPKFTGDGKKNEYGVFHRERGYWKLIIDRRMYDTKGRYQEITPVDTSSFTPDLVDPQKSKEVFPVTTVADDEGVKKIVKDAMALEAARPGGNATVDYDKDIEETVKEYRSASKPQKPKKEPKKKKHSIIGLKGAENLDISEGKRERVNNRETAERMEREGRHSEDIRMATGWERGKDGNWRYETDNYPDPTDFIQSHGEDFAKAREAAEALDSRSYTMEDIKNAAAKFKLSEVIPEDDEVFKAYPDLKDADVYFDFKMFDGGGWNPRENRMILAIGDAYEHGDMKEIRDSLIHELQHAIQRAEGFTPGSSMKRAEAYIDQRREELNQQRQDIRDLYKKGLISREMAEEQLQKIGRENFELGNDYGVYKRQAGEVEARNAATRAFMSHEERRNTTLEDTEDVPRIDQLLYGEQSNDPQQFIGKKAREAYEKLLADKRPDLPRKMRNEALDYLHSLADTKENTKRIKTAVNWLAKGSVRLPEDMYKIDQALSVAEKAKVDPSKYESPTALLDAHADIKPSRKRINPDEVPTLSNKEELADGVVIYDVDESEESRQAMRDIIDTHWGEDANPWCLLARDKEGNFDNSSRFWNTFYCATQKRVAFRNGKLLAFSASDTDREKWWDRSDKESSYIPYTDTYETGNGDKRKGVYDAYTGDLVKSFVGQEGAPGDYKEWDRNNNVVKEAHYNKDGQLDGEYYENGFVFDDFWDDPWNKKPINPADVESKMMSEYDYPYEMEVRARYKDGDLESRIVTNPEGGMMLYESRKDGFRDGVNAVYDPEGNLRDFDRYDRGFQLETVRYDEGDLNWAVKYDRGNKVYELDSYEDADVIKSADGKFAMKVHTGTDGHIELGYREFGGTKWKKEVVREEYATLDKDGKLDSEKAAIIPQEEVDKILEWYKDVLSLPEKYSGENNELLKGQKVPNHRHSIIGIKGAQALDKAEGSTKRMDALKEAERMEKESKDREIIWKATGWERGKDNQWRSETEDTKITETFNKVFGESRIDNIYDTTDRKEEVMREWKLLKPDDEGYSKLKEEYRKLSEKVSDLKHERMSLPSFMGEKHPIFTAYPELKDCKVHIEFNRDKPDDWGYYDPEKKTLWINSFRFQKMDQTFMHELQHAIQHIEGFIPGSNLAAAMLYRKERLAEIKEELNQLDDDSDEGLISSTERDKRKKALWEEQSDLETYGKTYLNQAGEVEARNASTRYGLSTTERANQNPASTEDVGRDHQLKYSYDKYTGLRRHSLIGTLGALRLDEAEKRAKNNEKDRTAALDMAREMERDAKDEKTIWAVTGWQRGKDGHWRYEIPDSNIGKIIEEKFGPEKIQYMKDFREKYNRWINLKGGKEEIDLLDELSRMLTDMEKYSKKSVKLTSFLGKNHPVFKAYPYLENYKVNFRFAQTGKAGEHDRNKCTIYINPLYEDMNATFMHELQHAIQWQEDYEFGSNPSLAQYYIDDRKLEVRAGFKDLKYLASRGVISTEEYNKRRKQLEEEDAEISKMQKYDVYRSNAGEVEARNASTRHLMTEEARAQTPPSETEDVSRDKQLLYSKDIRDGLRRHSIIAQNQDYEEELAKQKKVSYRELDPHDKLEKDIIRQLHTEGEYITVYRTMQMIDGKLYSPMAAGVGSGKKGTTTPEIKLWRPEAAEEHPELVYFDKNGNAKIKISKKTTKSKDLDVAYNPYIHTSYNVLNDQFTAAWNRPNLVVVECRVPKSELTSGYKADVIQNGKKVGTAKDAVGEMAWHSGPVSGQLSAKGSPRKVVLSRYDMPVRVLSNKEVAEKIHESIKDYSDMDLPWNLFHPEVKTELEKRGHRFNEKASGIEEGFDFDEAREWTKKNVNPVTDADVERINREHKEQADNTPEGKQRVLRAMSEHLKVPVTVLNSDEDIKGTSLYKRTKDEKERQRMLNSKGWFDHQTGEIVINMGKHDTAGDVAETILHEAVGHKGFREIFGEDGNTQLWTEVYDNLADDVRDRVNTLAGKNGYRDFAEATEEYAANLAQKGFKDFDHQEYKFWKSIRKAVSQAIAKIFETLNIRFPGAERMPRINDTELRQLLWNSYDHLVKGDLLQRAEDLARRQDILDEEAKTDASFRDQDDPIWGEQSQLTLRERMLNETLRQSQLHQSDHAAMQRAVDDVVTNLKDLVRDMRNRQGYTTHFQGADHRVEVQTRKATKAVGNFDKDTAARMQTMLRILNSNGYLQGIGKADTAALMKSVAESVGKDDNSAQVERVLDVVTDNLLRRANDGFGKALKLSGTRVNAKGVDALKDLDPRGVNMMEALKRGLRFDEQTLVQLITDAQNDMGDPDPVKAEDAADRFAGLSMAHDWLTNVKQLMTDEQQLRDQIRQVEANYAAGQITRQNRDQQIQTIKDAIREKRWERITNLTELTGRIYTEAQPSADRAQLWREQQKQRIEEIHHNANSDLKGVERDAQRKDTRVQRFMNNGITQFFLSPLCTFEQMLRQFGSKSVNGEGYLYDRFMRGWVDANQKEYMGYVDSCTRLNNKATQIFGRIGRLKKRDVRFADINSIVKHLDKMTATINDEGRPRDIELDQGQLLYLWMIDKMTDGRMKLRAMGIEEDQMRAIDRFLDPRLKEMGTWIQDDFLPETRRRYNETHRKVYGANMASIDSYFPLKIQKNALSKEVQATDPDNEPPLGSAVTGAIKRRKVNAQPIDIVNCNAFDVLADHVREMEHWNAFAQWDRDMTDLLSYKNFRNKVMNMTTVYGGGKKLFDNFRHCAQMASGSYQPTKAGADKGVVQLGKMVTMAKISFRMYTAFKQLMSFPAYFCDASDVSLVKNTCNPMGSWKWCERNLPMFRKRWESRMAGDTRLKKSEGDYDNGFTRAVDKLGQVGMAPNAAVDALTVAIGARSIYETKFAEYKRQHYSDTDAHRLAIQDAETAYNLTQQSSEGAFTSTIQQDRTAASVALSVFRNASMSYQRQLFDAVRNLSHVVRPGYRQESLEFMAKKMVRQGMSQTDADNAARRKYRKQITHDLVRVGLNGFILQFAWNLASYLPYLLCGDDSDKKKELLKDATRHAAIGGAVEGLAGGNILSEMGNKFLKGESFANYDPTTLPIMADMKNLVQRFGSDRVAAFTDLINLASQVPLGVNFDTGANITVGLKDLCCEVVDACKGNPEVGREAMMTVMRVLNCPQSQIDEIYFDAIGKSGKTARNMTPKQIAERYAIEKVKRGAMWTAWMYDDFEEANATEKKRRKADKKMRERLYSGDPETDEFLNDHLDRFNREKAKVEYLKTLKKSDPEYKRLHQELEDEGALEHYKKFKLYNKNLEDKAKKWLNAESTVKADEYAQDVLDYRRQIVKKLLKLEEQAKK